MKLVDFSDFWHVILALFLNSNIEISRITSISPSCKLITPELGRSLVACSILPSRGVVDRFRTCGDISTSLTKIGSPKIREQRLIESRLEKTVDQICTPASTPGVKPNRPILTLSSRRGLPNTASRWRSFGIWWGQVQITPESSSSLAGHSRSCGVGVVDTIYLVWTFRSHYPRKGVPTASDNGSSGADWRRTAGKSRTGSSRLCLVVAT